MRQETAQAKIALLVAEAKEIANEHSLPFNFAVTDTTTVDHSGWNSSEVCW